MNRLLAIAALFFACNEGHPQFLEADLASAPAVDMATPADLASSTPTDLRTGPTCGELVMCVFQKCGLTDFQCSATCLQGASPETIQAAGALTVCAATNCLTMGGGGGGGGPSLELFQCIFQNCGDEVGACDGLPFGGGF